MSHDHDHLRNVVFEEGQKVPGVVLQEDVLPRSLSLSLSLSLSRLSLSLTHTHTYIHTYNHNKKKEAHLNLTLGPDSELSPAFLHSLNPNP